MKLTAIMTLDSFIGRNFQQSIRPFFGNYNVGPANDVQCWSSVSWVVYGV